MMPEVPRPNCNGVLAGLHSNLVTKLQRVQNAAVWLVLNLKACNHISPALYQLHWLTVHYRIQYKLCLMMHGVYVWRCLKQRRQNHGGNGGGVAPAMLKPQGAKVSFHPRNNLPSLSLVDSQTSISLYSWFPSLIAGLQESSPEEPKMHQNSWQPGLCPGPHWGSLQRSSTPLVAGAQNPTPGSADLIPGRRSMLGWQDSARYSEARPLMHLCTRVASL